MGRIDVTPPPVCAAVGTLRGDIDARAGEIAQLGRCIVS